MFGIGMTELIVIFVIGLIVLGPKRLPEMARTLGRSMAELRRASTDLRREFMDVAEDARIRPESLPQVSDEPPQAGVSPGGNRPPPPGSADGDGSTGDDPPGGTSRDG